MISVGWVDDRKPIICTGLMGFLVSAHPTLLNPRNSILDIKIKKDIVG